MVLLCVGKLYLRLSNGTRLRLRVPRHQTDTGPSENRHGCTAVRFRGTASRRDGKLPSKSRPSGAYRAGRSHQRERLLMADVTIEARPNGPYVVTGTVELRDTNGIVLQTQARTVPLIANASDR